MRPLYVAALTPVVFLFGCKQCNRTPQVTADPGATSARPPPSTDLAAQDSDASHDAGAREVSLLRSKDARVAVSSLVDSPKASPSDLLDGAEETAWNGKTGDLVGGWIAFRLPKAAHVHAIVLSSGFAGRDPDGGDLFTMNHRITRVRVTREGMPDRSVDLDPATRSPQRIPIDAMGGDYRIEVLATLPGTKTTWRELVVSTFDVLGVPAVAKITDASVGVRVGSLAAPPWLTSAERESVAGLPKRGPWPSIDAYCTRFAQDLASAARAAGRPVADVVDRCPMESDCRHEPLVFEGVAGPPLQAMETVRVCDGTNATTWLAIQSSRGWFVEADELESEPCINPNSAGEVKRELVRMERPPAGPPALLVVQRVTAWSPLYGGDQGPMMIRYGARGLHVCRFVDGFVDCDEHQTLAMWNSADPFDAGADFPPDDQWKDRKAFTVLPDGGIELRAK